MKPLSDAFSPDVMAELARPVQSHDPRNAEIVEGETPEWYVIEVFASAQNDVVNDLVEHRYGVYVPEVDETVIKRGRGIDRRVPMFPGYVFVFMWYSDRHWQFIANTPGVVAIVGRLPEDQVDIVRAVENVRRPVVIEMPAEQTTAEPQSTKKSKGKRRRWKKGKAAKAKRAKPPRVITEQDLRDQIITTRAWSAFDDILELDSEGRNQTLRKALGLA